MRWQGQQLIWQTAGFHSHGLVARASGPALSFPTAPGELALARADGSYTKLLDRLAKTQLLILGDFGLAPLTDCERRGLVEVPENRYGRRTIDRYARSTLRRAASASCRGMRRPFSRMESPIGPGGSVAPVVQELRRSAIRLIELLVPVELVRVVAAQCEDRFRPA